MIDLMMLKLAHFEALNVTVPGSVASFAAKKSECALGFGKFNWAF